MVRAILIAGRARPAGSGPTVPSRNFQRTGLFSTACVLAAMSGCVLAPRSRMDECQQVAQSLRADNSRLKDRLLAVQGQNRDLAERAVDDGQRLASQDEAIQRLEHSVQAYQDDRTRLEAAYKNLVANAGKLEPDRDGSRTTRLDGTGAAPPLASKTPAASDDASTR